jgi:hypothetical protein
VTEGEPRRPGLAHRWLLLTAGCLAFVALALGVGAFFSAKLHEFDRRSRMAHDELAAVGALKTIGTSEAIFREGKAGYCAYGSLAQLQKTMLIDSILGSGTKEGYLFEVAPSASSSEFLWFAIATPVEPGVTGDRYFCVNQTGVIFYTTEGAFTLNTSDCAQPANALPVGRQSHFSQ